MTTSSTAKTVTLRRGAKGFGFTLAEQYPCYLSNVHPGGVADSVGLKAGDQLVSVGSVEVTHLPHAQIVRLLADSGSKLTLTVDTKRQKGSTNEELKMKSQEDGHCTESSMDSDSPVWRQQKLGAEFRLQVGSLRRQQQQQQNSVGAIRTNLTPATTVEGFGVHQEIARKSAYRASFKNKGKSNKKSTKYQKQCCKSSGNLWQVCNELGGWKYENSLPSSLRNRRSRRSGSSSKRSSGNLHRKGVQYSSARENRMNRSLSEPDYLAEEAVVVYKGISANKKLPNPNPNNPTSSMIAHADSGSSDLSTDSEAVEDRSVTTSETGDSETNDSLEERIIFQSVVVYIGAVPVANLSVSRRHVIRGALQSLRVQRARARTVLLQVFDDQVVVTNSRGCITHRLLVSRIAFASACIENKQYFGLCTIHPEPSSEDQVSTTTTSPDTSKSSCENQFSQNFQSAHPPVAVCHMFAADPQLHLHSFHFNYARRFGIKCSRDPDTGFCLEFPYISNPVLHALAYARRATETAQNRQDLVNSNNNLEQGTSASGSGKKRTTRVPRYVSSNSDSGIGGRDCELPRRGGACSSPAAGAGYSSAGGGTSSSSTVVGGGVLKKKGSPATSLKVTFEEKNLVTVFDDKILEKLDENVCENGKILTEAQIHFNEESAEDNDGYEIPNDKKILEDLKELVKETSPEQKRVFEGKNKVKTDAPEIGTYSSLTKMKSSNGRTGVLSSFRKQMSAESSTYPRIPKNGEGAECENFARTMSQQDLQGVLEKGTGSSASGKTHWRNSEQKPVTGRGPPFSAPPVVDREEEEAEEDRGGGVGGNFFVDEEVMAASGSGATGVTKIGKTVTKTPSLPEFDQMLADVVQRKPFEEFLQHQFCGENLAFWLGVEVYKNASLPERCNLGKRLFENHFSEGCLEPVNVDSSAMHLIQRAVETKDFPANLFDGPQYQIYHLMKYDCWPRFLKSDFAGKHGTGRTNLAEEENSKILTLNGASTERSSSLVSLTGTGGSGSQAPSTGGTAAEKQSKRKSLIPWKSKFIASRRKKTAESGPASVTLPNQQDLASTASDRCQEGSGSVGASSAPTSVTPTEATGAGGRISFAGSRKKTEWKKAGKQLSVPSEFYKIRPTSSGSVPCSGGSTSARQHDPVEEVESVQASEGTEVEMEATTSGVILSESNDKCCIAILPGGTRTTVQLPENMTVRQWLNSLANRHGFNPAGTELFDQNTGDKIDFTGTASRTLGDRIIRLETSVLFKLELPLNASSSQDGQPSDDTGKHRKLVAIRARSEHPAGLVLRPVLARYGLDLDKLVICLSGTTEVLPNSAQIRKADNRKLLVLSHQEFQDWVHSDHAPGSSGANSPALPGCSAQSSTGSSTASSPTDGFGEQGPTFHELPPSGTSSVTVGIAELPPKRRKAKAALPGESTNGSEDKSDSGAISGMLKFVRNKTNTVQGSGSPGGGVGSQSQASASRANTALSPEELSQNSARTFPGISPKLSRKSLGPLALRSTAGSSGGGEKAEGVGGSEPQEMKRQTLASARELKEQMKQDRALAELLTRAQANRMDDQRGTSPMTYDLPDFLKDANACQSVTERGGPSAEEILQKENIFDESSRCLVSIGLPENNRDFSEDCILPTAEEAEAIFGQDTTVSTDFSDPNLTERKSLMDYGFCEPGERSSLTTSSNVSVIRVCDELSESLLDKPKRKVTPHTTGRTSSLKCRPPPPPYPGKGLPGAPAVLVASGAANSGTNGSGRSRTPLYVPPSSFNAPVSKDLSSDVWKVDYV